MLIAPMLIAPIERAAGTQGGAAWVYRFSEGAIPMAHYRFSEGAIPMAHYPSPAA